MFVLRIFLKYFSTIVVLQRIDIFRRLIYIFSQQFVWYRFDVVKGIAMLITNCLILSLQERDRDGVPPVFNEHTNV